jgi:hypothetical protein
VNNTDFTMQNSIIYGKARGIDGKQTNGSNDIDHCTFFTDAATLGLLLVNTDTCHNTYAGGYSTEDFWTGGSAPTGTNNASADTSASTDYTSTVTSAAAADQFVNASIAGSADFHLKSGSGLEAQGTNTLSTDIDGDSRDGSTPDIGADEFVSVGGATGKSNPLSGPLGGPLSGPLG